MLPLPVLNAVMLMPWNKHLENVCKEAAKDLKKKAKSTLAEKLTEKALEEVLCKQAGKANESLAKLVAGQTKGYIKREVDKVEKALEKEPDHTKPGPLKLLGLRGELQDYQVKRQILDPEKPMKMSKPQGSAFFVPLKVKVLSKDKVELNIGGFIGIDRKILKGILLITYGGLTIGGRM